MSLRSSGLSADRTAAWLRALMGFALTALLLSGIYGCGDKKASEGDASSSQATASGGEEKKDGGSATTSSGGGGEASSTVAGEVPVYPGATKSQEAKMGNQTLVAYSSPDAIDAIHEFYAKEIPAAGWKVDADVKAATGASIAASKDGWTLAVAVAKNPTGEGSVISVTHGK